MNKNTIEQAKKRIAARLKKAVESSDLTAEQLAREAGIGKATLSQILSGKRYPSLETLLRLAHVLRVKAASFLD